jgi:hypothetical protein
MNPDETVAVSRSNKRTEESDAGTDDQDLRGHRRRGRRAGGGRMRKLERQLVLEHERDARVAGDRTRDRHQHVRRQHFIGRHPIWRWRLELQLGWRIRVLTKPAAVLGCTAALGLAGCGGGAGDGSAADRGRRLLADYVHAVEPIRLGTNRLLDRADPILEGYRDHRLSAGEAQRRFDALERRLAGYAVQIAQVEPVPDEMRAAQEEYAHTWILEDSYLSALAAAIPERQFDDLPDTKDAQRAAIIDWRTQLQIAADRTGLRLPADIQVAGRGEIAPSPIGD